VALSLALPCLTTSHPLLQAIDARVYPRVWTADYAETDGYIKLTSLDGPPATPGGAPTLATTCARFSFVYRWDPKL
jgi:hypothetical protein